MERAHQIQGTVRIAETLALAREAHVTLAQRGFIHGQNITNANGRFHFNRVGPGEYTLVVSLDGFKTDRTQIDVSNSSLLGLSIELDREAHPLPAGPATVNMEALTLSPKARHHQEQGLKEISEGQWEAGLAHFRQVIALHPDFASGCLGLGMANYFLQQPEPAERALLQSIALDGNLQLAYVFLGRLFNDQRRTSEAREILSNGLARGPARWDAYYELARALAAEEKFAEAEENLRQAHGMKSIGSNVHLLLADLLIINDSKEGALAEMKHYLELHPGGPFAGRVRARAESLTEELRLSGQTR
jgi:Flp pilus assembly protein TadD